jgi:hypothetical protein
MPDHIPACPVRCSRENWKDQPPAPREGTTERAHYIRTVCKICGRFVGYREAYPSVTKSQPKK